MNAKEQVVIPLADLIPKQTFQMIEKRVLSGERKADIYAQYPDEYEATLVARFLAQIPTPDRRRKYRPLNWILVIVLNIAIIWLVIKSRSLGYSLIFFLGLAGLPKVRIEGFGKGSHPH